MDEVSTSMSGLANKVVINLYDSLEILNYLPFFH